MREEVECLLSGDVDTGKAVLRDYINATIGFENLGEVTHTPQEPDADVQSEGQPAG